MMVNDNDSVTDQMATFERIRPTPGDAAPNMNRERPSPGMTSRRSIRPESISPQRSPSPSAKRLGTPEGSAFNPPRLIGAKKPIPGDMTDQNFVKRRPPSPGMGMMSMSPKPKLPSPGMRTTAQRGPPSPGMGASSRGPPSPGRLSPAPPGINDHSEGHQSDQVKPVKQKSVRFDNSGKQSPVPFDQNASNDEIYDESLSKQRFVFSKAPTGVKPPSRIDVVSTMNMNMAGPEGFKIEQKPSIVKNQATSSPVAIQVGRPSPKIKNDNPLRNNPLFLQKFAEASDSDSDEDSELQKGNAQSPQNNKLSGMEKMKKLAELSSASLLKPVHQTPHDAGKREDFGSPLQIVDEPENEQKDEKKEEQKSVASDDSDNFSNHPNHRSRVSKSPKRINQLAERLKKKKLTSPKSSPLMMDDKESIQSTSEKSTKLTSPHSTDNLDNIKNSSHSQIDEITHSSDDLEDSLPEAETFLPKKTPPASPANKRDSAKSLVSQVKAAKTLSPQKVIISSPANMAMSAKSAVKAAKTPSPKQTITSSPSAGARARSRRQISIGEKLEKKSATGPIHQQSDSSILSTGNKSTSSIRSRREMLDRARSRISRSPSPSPLLNKHMPSPSTSLKRNSSDRKKSVMKKMIEAREKKSQSQFDDGSSSSTVSDIVTTTFETSKHAKQKESKLLQGSLQSVPSLVAAPSDEEGSAIDHPVKIAASNSSEHLSVRKGLNLLKDQNVAMKSYLSLPEEIKPVVKEKTDTSHTLSQNVARLRVLKEKQKRREQMKEQGDFELKVSEKQRSKIDLDDDDLSVESTSKNVEEDDEFSIDEFPGLSPNVTFEPSPSSTLMESPHKSNRSQWADKMQSKLRNSSNSPENFHFDEDERDSWVSDSSANDSPGPQDRRRSDFLPKTKPPIVKNTKASVISNFDSRQEGANWKNEINQPQVHFRNRADNHMSRELNPNTTNNVSFHPNQSTRVDQPPPQEEQGEHIFVGAYAELLPRSTNPLFMRIVHPTLPSSLMAARTHISPITDVNNGQTFSSAEEAYNEQNSMQEAPSEENQPAQPFHSTNESDGIQPSQPETSFNSMQDNLSPQEFEQIGVKDPLQWNQFPSSNPNDVDFAPAQNLIDFSAGESNVVDSPEKDDGSQLQSTLIGQVHLSSMDESTNIGNGSSESVAEWWKNSYAHTQNDDVNTHVQSSLSRKIVQDDSDDDVFFGIEDASPNLQGRPKIKDNRKYSTERGRVDTATSRDSEFDEIMNGDDDPVQSKRKSGKTHTVHHKAPPPPPANGDNDPVKSKRKKGKEYPVHNKASPPPPPPPSSTPPNRPSSAKHKTRDTIGSGTQSKELSSTQVSNKHESRVSKDVSNSGNNIGKSQDSRQEYKNGTHGHITYESTFDSGTYGDGTLDDGTYDNGTYDDRSYSSRSSRSDGSDTFGSATLESMALNKRERRKWSAWDKKDQDSVYSNGSTHDSEYTMDTRQRNRILERRARAHEQLLMHAYTALSKPAKRSLPQKGITSPQFLGSGGSDVENQAPRSTRQTKPVKPSRSILKQRQILEKFCVKIKNIPFEVLKLNRENKWQTRYLTVSKEGSWLNNGAATKGDSCFCPLALLWVKKLNSSNDHSVATIDKQGKGGMIFTHLSKLKVDKERGIGFPLTKKQSDKFRDSVVVRLYSDAGGNSTVVTFRCTRGAAENITVGCSAIIDVLRGQSSKKLPGSSSQQYVAKHQSSSQMYATNEMISNPQGNIIGQKNVSNQDNGVVVAKSYADEGAPNLWEA